MRGRKPKPASLHRLQGTGADAAAMLEAKHLPEAAIPDPPAWLSPMALEEWRRVTEELHRLGCTSCLDSTLLAQYCVLTARLATDPGAMNASAHTQLVRVQAELGPTPVSRVRLARPGAEDLADPNGWREL